eukprot:7533374-Heterocapsa_arctica.AAC.1
MTIAKLVAKVSKLLTCHDRALMRLMQYVERHASITLHGWLRAVDIVDCKIVMSPDVCHIQPLARDLLYRRRPMLVSCMAKRQDSTAFSTYAA